jgi:arylsulfatase A-like enzyme
LGFLTATLALPALAQTTERPNIIMFLVDDMGWQDTSVPFYKDSLTALNHRYHTPNMERLAAMGVKFTQAYACAISSPSRCSLMSGMNAARHRVTNWTLKYDTQTDATSSAMVLPQWNYNGIQPDTVTSAHNTKNSTPVTTLPQLLRDNGYYTIHCGKAHFSAQTTPGADPLTMGFDVNIAGGANGAPASYLASDNFGTGDFHVNGLEAYYGTNTFLTEALTLEAKKALETPIKNKQPFYLYMSHYAVHAPYSKDTRFYNNYFGVQDAALGTTLNSTEACYAALVEGMDKSLGDLLDFIKDKNIADNTIVLFMSDNGGQTVSPRQGTLYVQNAPAQAGKGSAYEGGVHEPMMVYMPGVTKGGTENDNHVMIEDFFPTILDMAGVSNYKTVQTVDGQSFLPLLKDPTIERPRTIYWHFPNLWGETQDRSHGFGAYSSILKGDYRMIYFWETGERRLFNVKADIGEANNLATAQPDVLKDLATDLSNYLRSVKAQRPLMISTGKLAPWPDEVSTTTDTGNENMLKTSEVTVDKAVLMRVISGSGNVKQSYFNGAAVKSLTASESNIYVLTDAGNGKVYLCKQSDPVNGYLQTPTAAGASIKMGTIDNAAKLTIENCTSTAGSYVVDRSYATRFVYTIGGTKCYLNCRGDADIPQFTSGEGDWSSWGVLNALGILVKKYDAFINKVGGYTAEQVKQLQSAGTVKELSEAVAKLTPIAFDASKSYVLQNAGSYNMLSTDGTTLVPAFPDDLDNAALQWKFEPTTGGHYYMKSLSGDKYLADFSAVGTNIALPVTSDAQSRATVDLINYDANNKICWAIGLDGTQTGSSVYTFIHHGTSGQSKIVKWNAEAAYSQWYLLPTDLNNITDDIQNAGIVRPGNAQGAYYDLSGRRILRPSKGIYIRNGKKVVKSR